MFNNFYINLKTLYLFFTMRNYILTLALIFTPIFVFSQESLNLSLLGNFPYTNIERAQKLNDIWGYVDENGNEYALVGLTTGFSIVALDQADTLIEIVNIPGPTSTWRDIKTFGNYAFVTHDNIYEGESQALLVIDLNDIENGNAPYFSFSDNESFTRAHNIYIDENGIAYLTGADYGKGGAYMIDVNNPDSLFSVGVFDEAYFHDCVTRGDTMWGGAIYEGTLMAVDVSDKQAPEVLGFEYTPNLFTHNCWFSDDGNFIYTTDEKPNAYIASYDVSDIGNIKFQDKIQSFYSKETIPHNTHFLNKYLITSYYRDGVQITDVQYPDNMIDVGHYDTSPLFEGSGFNGAWGAYPYLPSGRILVTDMENGLFVFKPTYQRACYLHITVIDDHTNQELIGAEVNYLNQTENIDISGIIKTGTPHAGKYTITANKEEYSTKSVEVNLSNNQITEVEIRLSKIPYFEDVDPSTVTFGPNPTSQNITLFTPLGIQGSFDIVIYDILGKKISHKTINNLEAETQIQLPTVSGEYIIQLTDIKTKKSIETKVIKI